MKKQKGFTAIDFLVVIAIAIMGLLVGFLSILITSAEKKQPEKQGRIEVKIGFPSEKILTISAEEYCKSYGKDMQDYEMVGVHEGYFPDFKKAIPTETEVVVGFAQDYRGYAGTALILLPQ